MKRISQAGSFFWFLKKFIFVVDKSNFSDRIVSFIYLGGIKRICDLLGIQK